MGIFRKETGRYKPSEWEDGSNVPVMEWRRGGKLGALATAATLAFATFSDPGLDLDKRLDNFLGHHAIERDDGEMNKEAVSKYELALKQASPAELFSLRYTDTATITVNRVVDDGTGFADIVEQADVESYPNRNYEFRDGCLNDSAYDINGGQLSFRVHYSGLFSSVTARADGDVPTAAAQASHNPETDVLTIRSGNSQPEDLRFKIEGTDLRPLDQTTVNLLGTYGCDRSIAYSFTSPYDPLGHKG